MFNYTRNVLKTFDRTHGTMFGRLLRKVYTGTSAPGWTAKFGEAEARLEYAPHKDDATVYVTTPHVLELSPFALTLVEETKFLQIWSTRKQGVVSVNEAWEAHTIAAEQHAVICAEYEADTGKTANPQGPTPERCYWCGTWEQYIGEHECYGTRAENWHAMRMG